MRRLAFLIRSGMPLPDSLGLLHSQGSRGIALALPAIKTSIENGRSLSESFADFPGIFDSFSVQIVNVGESSGSLQENLEYLAVELKKSALLRVKILGALIYPALITISTIVLTVGLILFIFPKILPIFASLDTELPLATRVMLFLYGMLKDWGVLFLGLCVIAGIGFAVLYRKNGLVQERAERVILSIPIIGTMIRSYHVANASRTLALLLKSGMTLRLALPATAAATSHSLYRHEFERLAESVEQGEELSVYLRENRSLFPDIVTQMIAVGESSGTLVETLSYISEFYEGELDEQTKNLSTLIEPVLMIAMGCVVGFVAVSMIMPIYEITQHLHAK